MFKRFGLLGLAVLAGGALFAPATAFAQDPYQSYGYGGYYDNGYAAAPYYQYEGRFRGDDGYREHERQERRERMWREHEWREHEWREHERREHRRDDRYNGYSDGRYRY